MTQPDKKADFSDVQSKVESTEQIRPDFSDVQSSISSTEQITSATAGEAQSYTVQKGDTLSHIAKQTGRRPLVTSGHRSTGRRGSYHRKCMAADIRVPGVSVSRIVAAAKTAPGIGGIGTYCNGIVHVDVGPKRRWHYCGGHGLARHKKRTTDVAMR